MAFIAYLDWVSIRNHDLLLCA